MIAYMAAIPTNVYDFVQDTVGIGPKAFDRLLLTVAIVATAALIRWVVGQVAQRRISDLGRRYILKKTVSYVVGFALVLVCLRIWLGGITGLAAYLGLLSAGVAIALKDPLTNFAGWIFLVSCKPFTVSDRIEIADHRGDVIDIRIMQFTVLEIGNWADSDQSTGRIIHVPNGWLFSNPLKNYTQGFNFIWNELEVVVTFESAWHKAKQLLLEIAERQSAIQTEHAAEEVRKAARKYMIFFRQLSPIVWTSVRNNGVALTIRYLCEPRNRRSSAERIWEEILRSFEKHDDIDFAYPTTRFYDNRGEGKRGGRDDNLDGQSSVPDQT